MKKDYYEILGIGKTANNTDIKKAYRQLAIQYHPDKNHGNKESEEKFKEASEAYEILSNPEKRALYDQFGHAGIQGAGFSGFQNVEDVFSSFGDLFEDFFGFSSSKNRRQRGSDLEQETTIDFIEACFGVEKNISVQKNVPCEICERRGYPKDHPPKTCSYCHGAGQVRHAQGFFTIATTCPECNGHGKIFTKTCEECRGRGMVKKEKKLSIKIPAGVDDGLRLVLHHEGNVGERGGQAGDLYLLIHVKQHETFVRDHHHILSELPITVFQAILGTTFTVATIHGEEKIHIAPGTQSMETIILKGKGVMDIRTHKTGNHILTIKVLIPKHLTEKQKELLLEISKSMDIENQTSSENVIKKKSKKRLFGL
ncbi:MAG: molecular chaperone DnaJ [Deltaproteobacteria bacterium RIFCSPLOWO2_12_FULL_40_28]|nr:MAG: molecular chaperone DnaJ [Deltaproteobacteria bacterium RIFCSPHIGHO2_02_FULL_40_28]OGQ20906.1 MAG: molecular chaperone DnaJ [Deltaproteobacteria bacterium RIFCSPHIGHO2_12_FULL_40_32]OGQ39307.1 MAG: molecular chaperone DnaJ [Deltaproteobacteria bacterium RIFCSPLOWO2_02_FULL_40_36]OGQ54588.1 MAG: molecular chaperone DnaJ [Deltaproteobacteria bacterium RIFCSPLOWO2_12_FULL_40_28]